MIDTRQKYHPYKQSTDQIDQQLNISSLLNWLLKELEEQWKEQLNLKTYNSTLLDIYRISVGGKLKNIKRKYNNPKIYT